VTESGSDPISTPQGDLNRTVFDIGVLSAQVAQANETLKEQREAYAADKAATGRAILMKEHALERSATRWRIFGVVAAIVSALSLALGAVAYVSIRQSNEERVARTVTSCETAADNASKDNAQDAVILDLLTDVIERSESPGTAEFLAPYIEDIEANRAQIRDCTPVGIQTYFESGGTEGYLP
jgi:hypothetical protein